MPMLKKHQLSKLFQLTAISIAMSGMLSLAGCSGGGKSIDSIAPKPDLGSVQIAATGTSTDAEDTKNYTIYLTSTSNEVQMVKGSTITITARVTDANFGVAASKKVTFSITDPKLTGIVSNNNSSVTTDTKGLATITLQVVDKLTKEQKDYLKNQGLAVSASLGQGDVSINIKGSEKVAVSDLYNVFISTSQPKLKTGTDKVALTIRVTDKNGGVVAGVPVTLSIKDPTKYGLAFDGKSSAVTDDKGLVNINLLQRNTGINAQLNHTAEITALVDNGVATNTLLFPVTGTNVNSLVTSTSALGSGKTFDITAARLTDGSDAPVSNTKVTLMNADKEIATTTTDAEGNFTIKGIQESQLTATTSSNPAKYNFDLKIMGATEETSQVLNNIASITQISADGITISANDIVVNKPGSITVLMPSATNGQMLTLSTTKGQFSGTGSVQTKAVNNGQATFTISSNVPGIATIKAQLGNKSQSANLNFLSVDPAKLLVQSAKAEIGVNSSTDIQAKVLDQNDAPVKNALVQFSTIKDGSGGRLSEGLVKTDANGVAKVLYTSGNNPTASNGVIIRSKVYGVELPNGSIKTDTVSDVNTVDTSLTVQTRSSSIAFGLSDKLQKDAREVYYTRNASVFVSNNAGQPAANQQVTLALRPDVYWKGFYDFVKIQTSTSSGSSSGGGSGSSGTKAEKEAWVVFYRDGNENKPGRVRCPNEDANFNSVLDSGEDNSGDGLLQPGFVATILVEQANGEDKVAAGTNGVYNLTTDATGKINYKIRYLKQYAEWIQMKMTVATQVDGSESKQTRIIDFPVLIDDIDDSNKLRPNERSPFGIGFCNQPG